MEKMGDVFRLFDHGDGEWQQFIDSIKITNIHGWTGQEWYLDFLLSLLLVRMEWVKARF